MSQRFMSSKVGGSGAAARGPVVVAAAPMTGGAELVAGAIARRRVRLPEPAVKLAGAALAAAHVACWGRIPQLRGTRPARHRRKQLQGEKVFSIEDLSEVVVSGGAVGARAALALLGVLAGALGYEVRATSSQALRVHEAKARAAEAATVLQVGLDRDLADGLLEPHERAARLEDLRRSREGLDVLEASLRAPEAPAARLPLVVGGRA